MKPADTRYIGMIANQRYALVKLRGGDGDCTHNAKYTLIITHAKYDWLVEVNMEAHYNSN